MLLFVRYNSRKWEQERREARQGRLVRPSARWCSTLLAWFCDVLSAEGIAAYLVGAPALPYRICLDRVYRETVPWTSKWKGRRRSRFSLLFPLVKCGTTRCQFPYSSRLHYLTPLTATWEARECQSWGGEVLESPICLHCGQACDFDGSWEVTRTPAVRRQSNVQEAGEAERILGMFLRCIWQKHILK